MEKIVKTYHSCPMPAPQAALTSLIMGAMGTTAMVVLLFLDNQFALRAQLWHYLLIAALLIGAAFLHVFWNNSKQKGVEWRVDEAGVSICRNGVPLTDVPFRLLVLTDRKREWLERADRQAVSILIVHRGREKGVYPIAEFRIILLLSEADELETYLIEQMPKEPPEIASDLPEDAAE